MTIGETDEEGQVKVFFELNGQPRIIKVPNRAVAAKVVARRKAEDGNLVPCRGAHAGLGLDHRGAGRARTVKAGDVVATLEAMKMETALHAPRDGKIAEILVAPGQQIDARDLLMVLE